MVSERPRPGRRVPERVGAIMSLVAAAVFLLTALLGDTARTTFAVIGLALLVAGLNAWRSGLR